MCVHQIIAMCHMAKEGTGVVERRDSKIKRGEAESGDGEAALSRNQTSFTSNAKTEVCNNKWSWFKK